MKRLIKQLLRESLSEQDNQVTYRIRTDKNKYGNVSYIIIERNPCTKNGISGFCEEEYNGEIYTDPLEAESKLRLIQSISRL
jgi:hypothetical protein